MVSNSYNHTLGIWPELGKPKSGKKNVVKFVNDTTSDTDDPWLYLPANRTMLIPGPPVYMDYTGAMRAFPVHNKRETGGKLME